MEKKHSDPKKKDGRALPHYAPVAATENSPRVASPTALAEPETVEEVKLLDIAAEILLQLSTPNERLRFRQSPMALATVATFIKEFCRDMEGVTVEVPEDALPAVAGCIHNLFFCISTAIHYAVAHVPSVRVYTGLTEHEGLVLVEAECPAATADEALACFGLTPERMFILKRIAKDGEFSFRAVAGERATLVFTLGRTVPKTVILQASGDISLRAAFALPKFYFTN